jgi:hypothetical protein
MTLASSSAIATSSSTLRPENLRGTSMPTFKVPCPSCEAQVLIKNPNLVGKKVECPKCKYRFKVEEPKEGTPGEDKKADEKGKKAKKSNKKVLAGVLFGVLAIGVIAGVGYVVLGGDKKTSSSGTTGVSGPNNQPPPPEDLPAPPIKKFNPGLVPGVKLASNLAHPKSVAVFRFDVERILTQSELGPMLRDLDTAKLFKDSMGFDLNEVTQCFYCPVGDERAPFVVVQVRTPRDPDDAARQMGLYRPKDPTATRKLYEVTSNPFLTAVAGTFTLRSLLGDYLQPLAPTAEKPADKVEPKPLGVCIYDTQTILIGDLAVLESYLRSLTPEGFPPLREGEPPPAPDDLYYPLPPALRKAILAMENAAPDRPLMVWAETFDAKRYDPKQLGDDYKPVADALGPVAKTKHYGVRVTEFNRQKLDLAVWLFTDEKESANVAAALSPRLLLGTKALSAMLTLTPANPETPIVFQNLKDGTSTATGPMVGAGQGAFPGPGPGPGATGVPSGPRPRPGASAAPVGEGGPTGGPQPGPGPGPGPGVVDPTALPTGTSHVDLNEHEGIVTVAVEINWKEPVFNQIVYPRVKRETEQVKGRLAVASGVYDPFALAQAPKEAAKVPAPEPPKDPKKDPQEQVKYDAARAKYHGFPRGTVPRQSDSQLNLPGGAPVASRLSFYVDLLPYLGRNPGPVNRSFAWNSPENIETAEQWVPELIVPYYPSWSWRAEHPFDKSRTVGGTNYVGIAGIGPRAASLDPSKPEDARRMGMTGYGWNSTPAEVKDGLSNTIYLMQVKPGIRRPWMAGGGATLVGIDDDKDRNPMDDFSYRHPGREKPGSYALMGDASVRYVPSDIKREVLYGMATRDGGGKEPLPGEDAPLVPAPEKPGAPKPDMPMMPPADKKDAAAPTDEKK